MRAGREITLHVSFNPNSGNEKLSISLGAQVPRVNGNVPPRPMANICLTHLIRLVESHEERCHDKGHKHSSQQISIATWLKPTSAQPPVGIVPGHHDGALDGVDGNSNGGNG